MGDFEEIILAFVEAKIPKSKWGSIITRYDILQKIEDDDEEEIKDRLYDLLLSRINWVAVLTEIMNEAQNNREEEEEEDAEDNEDSEEEDSD